MISMQRFVTWASLGNKSKLQQQPSPRYDTTPSHPKDGWENEKVTETEDPLPFRYALDFYSADANNSTLLSDGGDVSAQREGAVTVEPASKLFIPVEPGHDAASPKECADLPKVPSDALVEQNPGSPLKLKHSKSFFGTLALAKKLRRRRRAPEPLNLHDNSVPSCTQDSPHRMTHRPQAVAITLSNDAASRERREEALRACGLLPPQDLSAIEAEADRRIDTLQKSRTSSPDANNGRSVANDIAQAWRSRNSSCLPQSPSNSESRENPMTKVDSPVDHPAQFELPTVGADPFSDSAPLVSSPSVAKFLFWGTQSPTQSVKAASFRGSIGHRSLSASSSSPEDLPSGTPTRGISEDVKTDRVQSAHPSPAPSTTSCSLGSQVVPKPQEPATIELSQCSVSPSHQLEDLQACPLVQFPSEPSSPTPSGLHPEALDVTARAQLSVPDLPRLSLSPVVSDILIASPTTPTLSPSVCYSSSESSNNTPTADNGELVASPTSDIMPIKGRRADIIPFAVKNGEGGLCQEVIMEGSEPFPDETDLDPFAGPLGPSLPTIITSPARPRNRASTVGPTASEEISKSASMVGLRRTFTNSLFRRPRARTTMSHLGTVDLSRPPSTLGIKLHNGSTIHEEASQIEDDEVRRLSELAFLT